MSQAPSNSFSPNQAITRQFLSDLPADHQSVTYRGTLLDRLSEVSSDQVADSTASRGELRLHDVKASILRELTWLLNTTRLETTKKLTNWPAVRKSVLNYGVPDLAGKWLHLPNRLQLERELERIIQTFEPRLQAGTVSVSILPADNQKDPHALVLQLEAEYPFATEKIPLRIQAFLDAETGQLSRFTDM